jgi:2-amino-4-hydroxy-6-hydroxymethyldihydropteridine diphosphokinase
MVQEITAYLSLGSNQGDREANLRDSLDRLGKTDGIKLNKHSSVYLTEPVGVSRQADFYNAVVEIKTTLSAPKLLEVVKKIEYEMGREPNSHFKPRPIDIDILLYGDSEIDTLDLLIPHSRLARRAFVLIPLLEINPHITHPTSFRSLKDYLDEIGESQKVERVIDAGDFARKPSES